MHEQLGGGGVSHRFLDRFDARERVASDFVPRRTDRAHTREADERDLRHPAVAAAAIGEPRHHADAPVGPERGTVAVLGVEHADHEGAFFRMRREQRKVLAARDLHRDPSAGKDDRRPQSEQRQVGGEDESGGVAHGR